MIRLPRISNVTDVDALAAEPGVEVLVTTEPSVVAGADLAILPGSRSTVADLAWLRERGLAERADGPRPEKRTRARDLRRLPDAGGADRRPRGIPRRPGTGPRSAAGLRSPSEPRKVLGRPVGTWARSRRQRVRDPPWRGIDRPEHTARSRSWTACRRGSVWGTMWHGAFENDEFRRAWLTMIAEDARSAWRPAPDAPGYADRREDHDQHLGRRGRAPPRSGDDHGHEDHDLGHRHRQRQPRPPDRPKP